MIFDIEPKIISLIYQTSHIIVPTFQTLFLSSVTGIASLSAMCGRSSQSVVSSEFDFTPAFTIAHELGHR